MTADPTADVAHLLRRAGFGARPEELDAAAAAGYEATVERLVGELAGRSGPDATADAVPLPTIDGPERLAQDRARASAAADPTAEERKAARAVRQRYHQQGRAVVLWWLDRMVLSSQPLVEKLTLVWHGHFATSIEKVKMPYLMLQQNQVLRRSGGGSFEALTQAVAKDPAMLIWLDARSNKKASPNENFGRELLELFTLGVGRYSEADVKEAARCFTGWSIGKDFAFALEPRQHDSGTKTFRGATGNFGGEDIVRMVTNDPDGARFVVSRLVSKLARPVTVDDPIVTALAPAYERDLDIAALVRALFLHPEFRSPATRNGLVKQPIEWFVGALRSLGLRADALDAATALAGLGQVPLAPPSVGGWPQNAAFLTTASALTRTKVAAALVERAAEAGGLAEVVGSSPGMRVAATERLLSVDFGPQSSAALGKIADDPKGLVSLALTTPEVVLA